MEYEVLPYEYWKKHDYLLFAYDVLGDMLRKANKYRLSEYTIKFDSENKAHEFENAEDMFEWMDNNNHHDTSLQMFKNHTFFCLLGDFCFFLYESLSCASRGKVTVAYSLLRKPIRDSLLYIEWLLADPEEFYQSFSYGSVEECDVADPKKFTRDRKKRIIKAASEKSYMGHAINGNNLISDFRFNGKDEIGLQRIWNQAMHLVTTHSNHYKTEDGNLNFIFADGKTWNDYWGYYYIALPHIMAYVLEICEALFIDTIDIEDFVLHFNRGLRLAKYAQLYPEIGSMQFMKDYPSQLVAIVAILEKDSISFNMECDNCGKKIIIDQNIVGEMINSWSIKCPNCKEDQNICKYFVDLSLIKID